MAEPLDIEIPLAGGQALAATLFQPRETRGAVMIAPATGLRRRTYASFAAHLADQGYGVITFENQGIGDSLRGRMRDCDVSLQDWGYTDLPAVLDTLRERFGDTRYHLVGHSAGGQLIGLMHNWQQLSSVFNFACSSGYLSNMTWPFWPKAQFFMRAFIPLSNAVLGYSANQHIGMGEPLPRNVAAQWAQWCLGGGYVRTAFGKTVHEHWYGDIDTPSLWVNASDDHIANDANVTDMIGVFDALPAERLRLDPAEEGVDEIGHVRFFSRRNARLWTRVTDWLARFD